VTGPETTMKLSKPSVSYDTLLLLAQTRAHAQAAKDELNGAIMYDNELKIGWGKTVPIPLAPLYVAPNFAGTAAAVAQRGQPSSERSSFSGAQSVVYCCAATLMKYINSFRPCTKCHKCKCA